MAHLQSTYIDGGLSTSNNITCHIMCVTEGIELYNPYGSGYIDFHKSATDDYNTRLICDDDCQLTVSGANTTKLRAGSFYATSDRRLKENIIPAEIDFIEIVNLMKIREFNFIKDDKKIKNVGLIAQELREILPEKYKKFFVLGDEDKDYLSINDSKLVYILAGALQESNKKVEKLEKEIAEIKKLLAER